MAEGFVKQWPAGKPEAGWQGDLSEVQHVGLNCWRATWHNNKDETHHFDISILNGSTIRFDEEESRQRWDLDYENSGDNKYFFKGYGVGNDARFEMEGNVSLAK